MKKGSVNSGQKVGFAHVIEGISSVLFKTKGALLAAILASSLGKLPTNIQILLIGCTNNRSNPAKELNV